MRRLTSSGRNSPRNSLCTRLRISICLKFSPRFTASARSSVADERTPRELPGTPYVNHFVGVTGAPSVTNLRQVTGLLQRPSVDAIFVADGGSDGHGRGAPPRAGFGQKARSLTCSSIHGHSLGKVGTENRSPPRHLARRFVGVGKLGLVLRLQAGAGLQKLGDATPLRADRRTPARRAFVRPIPPLQQVFSSTAQRE